jgi:hypothetical protein
MKNETANVDQRPLQLFALMFLLVWGLIAAVAGDEWLQIRAVTRAIVVSADGLSVGQYQYAYTIAGQSCSQTVNQEPPLPKPGTEIEIHYDPESVCRSETYDPGLVGPVIALAWICAVIPFIRWVWPRKGLK